MAVQIFAVIFDQKFDIHIFKNMTISSIDVNARFNRAVNILKSHTVELDLDSTYGESLIYLNLKVSESRNSIKYFFFRV